MGSTAGAETRMTSIDDQVARYEARSNREAARAARASNVDLIQLVRARALTKGGDGRRRREALMLSLVEIARAINVHEQTLLRWEAGLSRPGTENALAWLGLLEQIESSNADKILDKTDITFAPGADQGTVWRDKTLDSMSPKEWFGVPDDGKPLP